MWMTCNSSRSKVFVTVRKFCYHCYLDYRIQWVVYTNLKPIRHHLAYILFKHTLESTVADPGGVPRGPWPPPGPVKTSHKKDGHQRRLHRFHVSWPPPYPAAGSDAERRGYGLMAEVSS